MGVYAGDNEAGQKRRLEGKPTPHANPEQSVRARFDIALADRKRAQAAHTVFKPGAPPTGASLLFANTCTGKPSPDFFKRVIANQGKATDFREACPESAHSRVALARMVNHPS